MSEPFALTLQQPAARSPQPAARSPQPAGVDDLPEVARVEHLGLTIGEDATRCSTINPDAFVGAVPHPPAGGDIVVKYGGGQNSVAMVIILARLGIKPRAIVMADTGAEKAKTWAHVRDVMQPWLAERGMPAISIIRRADECATRFPEDLYGQCLRKSTLPSAAFGGGRCAIHFKADPFIAWLKRQPWMSERIVRARLWRKLAEMKAGGWVGRHPGRHAEAFRREAWRYMAPRRLHVAIGYDCDEPQRAIPEFRVKTEPEMSQPWYPLLERGHDRDSCTLLIQSEGLPLPPKSACTFCPNQQPAEWALLALRDPDAFDAALTMERQALPGLDSPDIGLVRRAKRGLPKRLTSLVQHPEWPRMLGRAERGEYDEGEFESMPCACAVQ